MSYISLYVTCKWETVFNTHCLYLLARWGFEPLTGLCTLNDSRLCPFRELLAHWVCLRELTGEIRSQETLFLPDRERGCSLPRYALSFSCFLYADIWRWPWLISSVSDWLSPSAVIRGHAHSNSERFIGPGVDWLIPRRLANQLQQRASMNLIRAENDPNVQCGPTFESGDF